MIKMLILSWLITRFKPIKRTINLIPYYKYNNIIKFILSIIFEILTCMTCLSFWTTLIYTNNVFLAALAAFISTWYEILLGQKETITKL